MGNMKTLYFDGTFVRRAGDCSSECKKYAVSNDLDRENNKNQVKFLIELDQLFKKYSIDRIYIDRNGSDDTRDEGTLVFESNEQDLRLAYYAAFSDKPKADHEFWNQVEGFSIPHIRQVPRHVISVVREMSEEETAEAMSEDDIDD